VWNVLILKVKRKIRYMIWCPRETLEERLEKMPSNAHCSAQGSSLVCWSILESLMGTAHCVEELGLCSRGLACQAGAWGRYIGFCLGYSYIWPKIKSDRAGKIFCKAHNFVPRWNFDERIFACICGLRYRASKSHDARARYRHNPAYQIYFFAPLVSVIETMWNSCEGCVFVFVCDRSTGS
jgi:hypothetical protein